MQFSTSNRQALLKGYSLPFGIACINIRMYVHIYANINISILLDPNNLVICTFDDSCEKTVEKSRLVKHQLTMKNLIQIQE